MYRPIQDYAIIGNLRSAVLVSKDGSIDWAPAPFIDSPSVFAALLDDKKGGYWKIAPEGSYTANQHYDGASNVLVTEFKTKDGVGEVIDFIPLEKEKTYVPDEVDTTFRIHRKVQCKKGKCVFAVDFMPRFDYARGETTVSPIENGLYIKNKEKHGTLESRVRFTVTDHTARGTVALDENESTFLIFRYNIGTLETTEGDTDAHHNEELAETKEFWESWVHRCDLLTCPVAGEWHDLVVRSSLVLKILFFEPVGTIAAAPTTSLPDDIGGVRNWDYRFSWTRDSAFTLMALSRLGYTNEAKEYVRWIFNICHSDVKDHPEKLQVLYRLHGENRKGSLEERTLDHLEGYKGSKPVRVGNKAYDQKQWDIYGGILDMVWTVHTQRGHGHVLSKDMWELLRSFANYVMRVWRKPDKGIWEMQTKPQHFVYSKVMCWVALDRAIKISEAHDFEAECDAWKRERDAIYREIMERGWSEKKESFVQSFDSDILDASLLVLPAVGFISGDHPRMLKTIERIAEELYAGDGLLYRYTVDDGLPGRDHAFLLMSFWLVDALVLAGQHERARKLFEKILSYQNHVGLYSEQVDPQTKDFLGNFPQAYTHIGLINSVFHLNEYKKSP